MRENVLPADLMIINKYLEQTVLAVLIKEPREMTVQLRQRRN